MEKKEYLGCTPDYIDRLLDNQVFVFGSNSLGYHTGGASKMARRFGAIWGQAEGIQGQSYAIPVDFGKGNMAPDIQPYIDRFIVYAKKHPENHFLVTRVGCGIAGYTDKEMAKYFREALYMNNVSLPRSFVNALHNSGEQEYDLERFVKAQGGEYGSYQLALKEIKSGRKTSNWIWYIFPQIKGLGHSFNSEFYGISGEDEARAYLNHPILGSRLREITKALLNINSHSAYSILGRPDDVKVQSCMTLFNVVSPNDIFAEVLIKYYDGNKCPKTMMRIENRQVKPSLKKLTVTKDFRILVDNNEIKMEPLIKAVYLLFLRHPEGITFKELSDYRKELLDIYKTLKPMGINKRTIQSIEDVTNPLLNSINEKCARIRSAFINKFDEHLAKNYFITGERGGAKKITLPRDLVIWE